MNCKLSVVLILIALIAGVLLSGCVDMGDQSGRYKQVLLMDNQTEEINRYYVSNETPDYYYANKYGHYYFQYLSKNKYQYVGNWTS